MPPCRSVFPAVDLVRYCRQEVKGRKNSREQREHREPEEQDIKEQGILEESGGMVTLSFA
jgi:hypothetical protein